MVYTRYLQKKLAEFAEESCLKYKIKSVGLKIAPCTSKLHKTITIYLKTNSKPPEHKKTNL